MYKLLFFTLVVGCSSPTQTEPVKDVGTSPDPDMSRSGDSRDAADLRRSTDSGDIAADRTSDQTADANMTGCLPAPSAPQTVLTPELGELYYRQIGLGGFTLGESAIVVGPHGGAAFLDVGNDAHDDDLLDAWNDIGGGAAPRTIEYAVITHFHADHADGLDKFFDQFTAQRVITRGAVNGGDVRDALRDELCETLDGQPFHDPICAAEGSCLQMFPAFACKTFNDPLTYDFGDAAIEIFAANGVIRGAIFPAFVGDGIENSRSVVGQISFNNFQLVFAGDLNGGGSDTDDLESFYVDSFFKTEYEQTEVLQSNHHGRDSSNNLTWINAFLPIDGKSRNVVAGVSQAHVGSPDQDIVDRYRNDGRLGTGKVWSSRDATLGGVDGIESADGGDIIIATKNGGQHYIVQSVDGDGNLLSSESYSSVECQP